MREIKVGDVIKFTTSGGIIHNALVIHVWQSSLNIVYITPETDGSDNYGNARVYETSVPWRQEGMSGFYIE